MQKAGAPVVFERLEGAGHVPWPEYGAHFEQESVSFLYEHLDLQAWLLPSR